MRPAASARAFTLLETVFVMVGLGIIAAIGVFSYQSVYRNGHDTDAKERLHAMATLQAQIARDFGRYSDNPVDLHDIGEGSAATVGDSEDPKTISVRVGTAGNVGLALRSASGECLYMRVTPLLSGADPLLVPGSGTCNGANALADGEDPVSVSSPMPALTTN